MRGHNKVGSVKFNERWVYSVIYRRYNSTSYHSKPLWKANLSSLYAFATPLHRLRIPINPSSHIHTLSSCLHLFFPSNARYPPVPIPPFPTCYSDASCLYNPGRRPTQIGQRNSHPTTYRLSQCEAMPHVHVPRSVPGSMDASENCTGK